MTHIDGTVPTAAEFNANFVALNTEARGTTVGGTGLAAYSTGDVLYASATNTLSRLAIGTRGYVLAGRAGLEWSDFEASARRLDGLYSNTRSSPTQ